MRKLSILLSLSVLCMACQVKARPTPQNPLDRTMQHKVSYSGETLGLISKWYTGTADNWKVIASKNPRIQVTKLQIGDTVLIPVGLVKTVQPFPKKMTGVGTSSKRRSTAKRTKAPKEIVTEEMIIPTVAEVPAPQVNIETNIPNDQSYDTAAEPVLEAASEFSSVSAPVVEESSAESNVLIDDSGKSVDQLLQEERAAVEQLKQELAPRIENN